jgi:hypothetical protein
MPLVLIEVGEHFQKNILREILLGNPPGQAGTHNADDQRVKMINQLARRHPIPLPDTGQAAKQIKRKIGRHKGSETLAYTTRKTPPGSVGYTRYDESVA